MYTKAIRTNLQCVYSQATKPAMKARHASEHLKAREQAGATYNFDGSQTHLQRFANLKHSKGNYLVDTDGNTILDLVNPQPLGYNDDYLSNLRQLDIYDRFLTGKVDCSNLPTSDYADLLREHVMPIAPSGTSQVHLTDGSISSANEAALSVALTSYAMKHKRDFKSLSVLGFSHASHGQSIALLSCSDEAVNHANIATYNWPIAPLPALKYPLAVHQHENIAEEARCIEAFEKIIKEKRDGHADVGTVIIEPITAYGNRQATPLFYKKVRAICKREGIPFVVDETRTGFGQTGKMWAHEHWYLSETDGGSADFVTFGGKTGISGFYSTLEHRLNSHCTSYDQEVDMAKLLNFGHTWRQIQYLGLLELVQDSSSFLKIELNHIQRDRQNLISNVRGNGTFIGFDAADSYIAASLYSWLLKSGVNVARVGPTTLGLRPSLILGPKHAKHLRESIKAFHPNHSHKY